MSTVRRKLPTISVIPISMLTATLRAATANEAARSRSPSAFTP